MPADDGLVGFVGKREDLMPEAQSLSHFSWEKWWHCNFSDLCREQSSTFIFLSELSESGSFWGAQFSQKCVTVFSLIISVWNSVYYMVRVSPNSPIFFLETTLCKTTNFKLKCFLFVWRNQMNHRLWLIELLKIELIRKGFSIKKVKRP